MLDLNCTNEQKIRVRCNPVTATGRPADIDGALRAEVVAGNGTAAAHETDRLSVWLISPDTPGDTSYVLSADADLGEGVVLLQDTAVLHVAGALADNLGMVASAPEPK